MVLGESIVRARTSVSARDWELGAAGGKVFLYARSIK